MPSEKSSVSNKKKKVSTKSMLSADPVPEKVLEEVNEPVKTVDDLGYEVRISSLQESILTIVALTKGVGQEIKKLQKEMQKMQKQQSKKKRRVSDKTKEPSGFAKPTLLSDEMCSFLSVPKGTLLSRTDVTRKISQYIREKDLQNPKNRREIFPNGVLRKLLKVGESEELTFFNLQKYLKIHFVKASPV